jgi:hypothetical protein
VIDEDVPQRSRRIVTAAPKHLYAQTLFKPTPSDVGERISSWRDGALEVKGDLIVRRVGMPARGEWPAALLRTSFKIGGAVGAFMGQAGRRGMAKRMLVARASRHVAIQRSVQGRIRACRSF